MKIVIPFKLPNSDTNEMIRIDVNEIASYQKDIVEIHGKDRVYGTKIVLKSGVTIQIKHEVKFIDEIFERRNMKFFQ